MSLQACTTIEGFAEFAETINTTPTPPTTTQLEQMSPKEIADDVQLRRRYLANLPTVPSPIVRQFDDQLDELVSANAHRRPGDKIHAGLIGIAGIGKTTTVLHAAKRIYNRAIAETGRMIEADGIRVRHVPVLYCTAPAVQSFKQLIGTTLRPFDPGAIGNAEAMTDQLLHLLRIARTQVVVIDDAHALRGRNRASLTTADSLKALINRIPATMVFVGTGLENSVLFGSTIGGMDDPADQIRHRVVHLVHPSYRRPTAEDPGEFAKLVGALEARISDVLRRHRRGTLTSKRTIHWLYDQTEGVTARLVKWLSAAAMAAVGHGERIDRPLLKVTPSPGLNK